MEVKIGLECHVQLNTKTKIFCGCPTYASEKPNSTVCPTCLGMPGSKPRLNKKVFEYGIKAALALKCKLPKETFFSRKTYFYPDMPKNFQITQYETPIAKDGLIKIGKEEKPIRIRRINIEEDPGKLIHVGGDITNAQYVLIDYNRSGIPLLEIVTDPDLSSPEEARIFLDKLRLILEYLKIFDVDAGLMKCDANISIGGGNRVEIKNILGFRAVEKALKFELLRQQRVIKTSKVISQETRHFDEASGVTKSLRIKETEEEYGYIFEPDLPSYDLSEENLKQIEKQIPELPDSRVLRLIKQYKLNKEIANAIVNSDIYVADFFEKCSELYPNSQKIGNWIALEIIEQLNKRNMKFHDLKIKPEDFVALAKMVDNEEVSDLVARRKVILEMVETGSKPVDIVKQKHYMIVKDEGKISEVIREVIKKNKKVVAEYKTGKKEAIHYLVGEVCKKVKVNPKNVLEILEKELA
jgi:aspartyl-tRNA(Asn)/glutamyl-tRNA(Gln) amidotransferase subunit B